MKRIHLFAFCMLMSLGVSAQTNTDFSALEDTSTGFTLEVLKTVCNSYDGVGDLREGMVGVLKMVK